jgi:chromosome segregation ATPase
MRDEVQETHCRIVGQNVNLLNNKLAQINYLSSTMPRPQKYTDSDISAAIELLAAAGEDVNPMRVRMRLGGGNVVRIKAIIEQQSGQLAPASLIAKIPEGVSREFQRLSGELSQQMLLIANKCWAAACVEAGSAAREENARLLRRLEKLEVDLAASTDLVVHAEGERDAARHNLDLCVKGNDELSHQCGDLRAALRNAESDLRATQKVVENFERNQRQDRSELRQSQKRIEELVGEVATLKAHTPRIASSRKSTRLKESG